MDDQVSGEVAAAERLVMKAEFPKLRVLNSSDIVNHFVKCFKTVLVADINGYNIGRFENNTRDDTHAEDNLMAWIYNHHEQYIQKGWLRSGRAHELEPNVLKIVINNSPCERCAAGLVELRTTTAIDRVDIEAANVYAGGDPVDALAGSGVIVDWFDVEAALARQGYSLEDDVLGTWPALAGKVDEQKRLIEARRRKTGRTQDRFG